MLTYFKDLITSEYQNKIGVFASLVTDQSGRVEWVSDKFLELIGKEKDEVIGRGFPEVSELLFVSEEDIREVWPIENTAMIDSKTAALRVKLSTFSQFGRHKVAAVFLNK